jgi:minimal PKS chain-length factor (CLF/KS beta)
MLVGGGEAPFAPFSMACQYGHGLLSYSDDPDRAYLPFAAGACGFSPAEGGAVLTVEARDSAEQRGALPLAAVAGHGATHTGTLRLAESARGLERAARDALAEAGCAPEQVDVVFADAYGVPEADRAEVEALHALFGPGAGGIPVTAPKAGFGRAYSCAALLDVVLAVLTLRYGLIPPTPYVGAADYDIDLVVGTARRREARTALVLSRGLSGGNSALVLRAEP